jgi:hypothetical protein
MSDGTTNKAIATGRVYVDYDPLMVLKELRARIGYNAGYVIRLGDSQDDYMYRRLAPSARKVDAS